MFRHMVKENGNKTKKGVDVRTYQVRWFRIWTLNQLYFKIEPVHSPAGFYKTRTTRRPRQIWCAAGWNALFAYAASLLLIAIVFSYANPWATPRFKLWLLPRLERFLGAFAKLQEPTVVVASPHATTRLLWHGFSWNFIFEDFSKICQEISSFIKICTFTVVPCWMLLRIENDLKMDGWMDGWIDR